MAGSQLSLSVASLRAAYPAAMLPPETVAIYQAALSDLDVDDVQDAVAVLVKTSKFPPTIAEIRTVVAKRRLGLPSEFEAWCEAERRASGTWEKPKTPIVTEALTGVGGIWAVKTSENVIATRAQFLNFYRELRDGQVAAFMEHGRLPELTAA